MKRKIREGDTWKSGSATCRIRGVSKCLKYIIYSWGTSYDVEVIDVYTFRREFKFLYVDPKRPLTLVERFICKYNNLIQKLLINVDKY